MRGRKERGEKEHEKNLSSDAGEAEGARATSSLLQQEGKNLSFFPPRNKPEKQVIYPALEAKVANVTLSYQVEHEDEVREAKKWEEAYQKKRGVGVGQKRENTCALHAPVPRSHFSLSFFLSSKTKKNF